MVATWRAQQLASAHLADEVSFPRDVMASDIFSIPRRIRAINRLAVHLGKKNVGNRVQNALGRALQKIGQSHQQSAISQAYRIVYIGKSVEIDFHFGQGSPGTKLTISFVEEFKKAFTHDERRVARLRMRSVVET